jgi:immune inhibitor A
MTVRMTTHRRRGIGVVALAAFAIAMPAAVAPAADDKTQGKGTRDDRRLPFQVKFDDARRAAITDKVRGKAAGKTHKAKGRWVELSREGTDRVFVVITEFGNARHSSSLFADQNPDGTPASNAQVFDGPLHNSIPEPDRAINNRTLWQPDYTPQHYDNMYFNRMAKYYESQSSGRYSVEGQVTEWVKVPFNEARYGRDVCGSIICNNTWFLIRDAMAYWVKGQLDAGKTTTQIAQYLRTFDKSDRYDIDGDGNFSEPDGFIDHFQIVHAGGDQAAADPQQGSDAIWSHRWYAAVSGGGPGGLPGVNAGQGGASGGLAIPHNPVGVWVGDYTIQPENGGLGVFAHEFGHDLGLPDLYDTSGNTGGAENSTGFWSLMSSGANLGDGGAEGIGDAPPDLGAWEKFQLGWLGCDECEGGRYYDLAKAGAKSDHAVGPAEGATKNAAQAVIVELPDKRRETATVDPKTGSYAYWSSAGNDLDTTMTKAFTLAGGATVTADAWYDIEDTFDYAFLELSSDDGATWTPVLTNLSDPASRDQSGFNSSGTGLTGSSGGEYRQLTATLPSSGPVLVRFRYRTDSSVAGRGFAIDNLVVAGGAVDGAEADAGWTFDGFKRTTGTQVSFHLNAYIAENRGYRKFDSSLRTAYNFGFVDVKPDLVEHFPYQDGLLISYWDESFDDNNVGDHTGGGRILPIDAHPTFFHSYDGHLLRPRTLAFDSTFGREQTDAITIHKDSHPTRIPSQPAVPVFDDRNTYWFDNDGHGATGTHAGRFQPGWYGVDVPKTGTQIRVKSATTENMQVEVRPVP